MTISKTDLNNFVDRKIAARTAEAKDAISKEIDRVIQPILRKLDYSDVENGSLKLLKSIRSIQKELANLKNNTRDSIGTLVNYASSYGCQLTTKVREELYALVVKYVEKSTDYVDSGYTEVNLAIEALRKTCRPQYQKIKDLETLNTELHSAIKVEASGKRAYNAIAALGVDVRDFEEHKNSTALAVIQLSVNAGIMN